MSRLVEVSHEIEPGMATYPGLPGPVVSDFLSREATRGKYAEGTTFAIARVDMVANTGTYVDAPIHRFAGGRDIGSLPLDRLADLDGVVVDATSAGRAIETGLFDGIELAGRAVIVRTGWSRQWGTPAYFEGHPFLTRAAAERLVRAGPALVGIDSLNIDDSRTGSGPRTRSSSRRRSRSSSI